MNNSKKGKILEEQVYKELEKVIKYPYNLVDNNIMPDQYLNQLCLMNKGHRLYQDKSFIRGDFLIYDSLSNIIMIDAKNYKNKKTIEKTVDVNKILIFLKQNIEYIKELGNNVQKLQNLVYRPEQTKEIEEIGSLTKESFINFINFLENGTIHHHSSPMVHDIKIKKYFIYQIDNETYSVCSFKELGIGKISVFIKQNENTQKIIFKQKNRVLCYINSSNNHMTLHHHEENMMNASKFSNLKECVHYIKTKCNIKAKDTSSKIIINMINRNNVVSKNELIIDLMLKNISLQNILIIYEKIESCKKIISLPGKFISLVNS